MRRSALVFPALIVAALACGGEDPPKFIPPDGGSGGAPPPVEPQVGELTFRPDNSSVTGVIIRWDAATDDVTPAAELTYELRRWNDRPSDPATVAPDQTFPANCCTFNFSPLVTGEVFWFQLVVRDADGNVGSTPLQPWTGPIDAPTLTTFSPTSGGEEDRITIRGTNLLDEPIIDDALLLNGVPIDLEPYDPESPSTGYLEDWSNTAITIRVPENAQTGKFKVTVFDRSAETVDDFVVE